MTIRKAALYVKKILAQNVVSKVGTIPAWREPWCECRPLLRYLILTGCWKTLPMRFFVVHWDGSEHSFCHIIDSEAFYKVTDSLNKCLKELFDTLPGTEIFTASYKYHILYYMLVRKLVLIQLSLDNQIYMIVFVIRILHRCMTDITLALRTTILFLLYL